MAADFDQLIQTEEDRQNYLGNVPAWSQLDASYAQYSIAGRYIYRWFMLQADLDNQDPAYVLEQIERLLMSGKLIFYGQDPFIVQFVFSTPYEDFPQRVVVNTQIAGINL